jgi:hypothetical protein
MTAMLSSVIVIAAFAGLAGLGAILVVALFRVSGRSAARGRGVDAGHQDGDFEKI